MLNFVVKKGRELELIYITVSYSNIIRYNNILLKTFIANLNIGPKISSISNADVDDIEYE